MKFRKCTCKGIAQSPFSHKFAQWFPWKNVTIFRGRGRERAAWGWAKKGSGLTAIHAAKKQVKYAAAQPKLVLSKNTPSQRGKGSAGFFPSTATSFLFRDHQIVLLLATFFPYYFCCLFWPPFLRPFFTSWRTSILAFFSTSLSAANYIKMESRPNIKDWPSKLA